MKTRKGLDWFWTSLLDSYSFFSLNRLDSSPFLSIFLLNRMKRTLQKQTRTSRSGLLLFFFLSAETLRRKYLPLPRNTQTLWMPSRENERAYYLRYTTL